MAKKKGAKGRRRPPPRPGSQSGQKSSSNAGTKPAASAPVEATAGTAAKGAASKAGAAKAAPAKAPAPKAKGDRSTPTRAERIEAAHRARRRKSILTRLAVVGAVVIVAGVVAWIVVGDRAAKSATISDLEKGSCEYDESFDRDAGAGRNHVTSGSPQYETNPPSGGNHLTAPAPAGTYTEQQLPQDGQIVHSMEHGYVVIWYKPDIGEEKINALKGVTDKHVKDVLLVPRPQMEVPVAATVWHKRLLCQDAEPEALEIFVTEFVNEGPEKVPHQ